MKSNEISQLYIYGHTLSDGAGEYLDENLLTNKFVNSSPQKKKT